MSEVIGLEAKVVWIGEGDEPQNGYISFGKWDEQDDEDDFGVPDSAIFYYATRDEVPSLYEQDIQRGWYIKSHNERTLSE